MAERRHRVTVVEIRCPGPKRHLIATLHPIPELGPATDLELVVHPARWRPGIGEYATGGAESADGDWLTTAARSVEFPIADLDSADATWAPTMWWACRCGINRLNRVKVSRAAWEWSVERRRNHGNTPKARVVLLARSSMP